MLKKFKRKSTLLFVIAVYIAITLCVLNIAVRIPEFTLVIMGYHTGVVALSVIALIIITIIAEKERTRKVIADLSKIMNNINAMVILWDADFHYVEVNEELTKVLGYTSDDFDKTSLLEKVLPADAFAPSLQAIINNRDEEFQCIGKDGSRVCTIWNTSLMHVIQNKKRKSYIMMSIGVNMTETLKMKEELIQYSTELAKSENKYSMSMELSEIGLILKESGLNDYYISDQTKRMFGFETSYISVDEIYDRIHPKDMPVFEMLAKTINGDLAINPENIHSVEFRAAAADGNYHWYEFRYKIMPDTNYEMARIGGSIIDITKDKEKDRIIERMAYIDDITEIYNRNKFMQIGQEIFETYSKVGLNYWVIVTDIDNFHIINDTCGYLNGNKLLSDFAKIVTDLTNETGFAARIGGDNFALIFHDNGNDELPVNTIKEIQSRLSGLCRDAFKTQTLTCSAGYCKMSDGGDSFAKVLDYAEFSLSLSDGTRNSICRYDHTIHEKFIAGTAIENELSLAIDNHELALYYQPKISLTDGTLIGMEALIRWIKPDGTVIPPNQFIPIAENSLLITRISHFVLNEACRQNKEWQDKGYPPITVSINLTAVDFYQTDVKDSIQKALSKSGLAPNWLDVELTESLALKDIDHAISQMNEIKNLGVKLSMDDFGTGYSSLSYIQVLPITLLKLDRSFIMYLEEDAISREIVSAVIRIAKSKKIETIAEGIETIGQANILKQSGCDHAQGYFFGKPMNAEMFEDFMAKRTAQAVAASEV